MCRFSARNYLLLQLHQLEEARLQKSFIEHVEESKYKIKLKDQKVLSGRSMLFFPDEYFCSHFTVEEKIKSFDTEKGPFAPGKIRQVHNVRNMIDDQIIE